jgi:hypothetical protein
MESSSNSSPAASDDHLGSHSIEQDPLALPSVNENSNNIYANDNDISFKHPVQQENQQKVEQQQQNNACGDATSNSDKETSSNNNEHIYSERAPSSVEQQQLNDPLENSGDGANNIPYQDPNLLSHQMPPLQQQAPQQQQQYDSENPEHNPQNMMQQHPPPQEQKTFSHSIENLSKTSSNDIKM